MKLSKLTKPELEEILKNANFTEDEEKIFNLLCKGKSLAQISTATFLPISTLSRRIKEIKEKVGEIDMKKTVPVWEKVTITLEEAVEYSNIGINKLREITNNPRCTFVIYVGRKRLIKRKEFEKFISENVEL